MQTLLRAGEVPAALDAARAAVAASPRDPEAHELLIDILMSLGLGTSAQSAYQALVTRDPQDPLYVYLLGRATLGADGARAAYGRALDLDPKLGRAWMGLAAVDRAEGKLEEARVKYNMALSLDPSLGEAWAALWSIEARAGDPEQALSIAQRAIQAVPDDPDPYLAAARLQPQSALATLAKGAAVVDDDPRLFAALGRAQLEAGALEEARASFERSLTIYPSSPQTTLDLALAEERIAGQIDAEGAALLERGRAAAGEDPARALEAFTLAAQRYPTSFLPLYARGSLLAEHRESLAGPTGGALEQAEADLRAAWELAPASVDVQGALGLLLLSRGMAEEAAPLLDSAALARPQDIPLGLASARAHDRLGDSRGPVKYSDVIERFPADPRGYMALAESLSAAGDTQGAYEALTRGVQRTGDGALLVALAAAAMDLGRPGEAAAMLQQIGDATGSQAFLDAAERLRAAAN